MRPAASWSKFCIRPSWLPGFQTAREYQFLSNSAPCAPSKRNKSVGLAGKAEYHGRSWGPIRTCRPRGRGCIWRELMKRTLAVSSLGRPVLKLLWVGGLILGSVPALAQKGGGTHPVAPPPPQAPATPPSQPPTPPPPQPPATFPSATNPWDQNDLIQRSNNKPVSSKIAKDDNCFLPPLNGLLPARWELRTCRFQRRLKGSTRMVVWP